MDYLQVALRNDPRWRGVGHLKHHRRHRAGRPWSIAVREAWYLRQSLQTHRSSRTAAPAYQPPPHIAEDITSDAPATSKSRPRQDASDVAEPPDTPKSWRPVSSTEKQPQLATKTPQLHPRVPSWFTTKSQGQGEAASSPVASNPVPSSPFLFSAFISSPFLSSSPVASEAQQELDSSPAAPEAQQDANSSLAALDDIHDTHDLGQIPQPSQESVSKLTPTGVAPSIPSDESKANDPPKTVTPTPAESRTKRQRGEELDMQTPTALKRKKKQRVSHDPPIVPFNTDVQTRENIRALRPRESNKEAPAATWKPTLNGKPKIRVPKRRGHEKQPTRLGKAKEVRPTLGERRTRAQRQRLKRLAARQSRAQVAEAMAQHETVEEGDRQVNVVRLPFIPVPRQEWGILPGKLFQRHPVAGRGVVKKY